ncbi:MAG: hypothetical protein SHS37scaffold220_49 [Phage 67_12]|nr:MAG: hypothetical protein SHS37scaffold220_49 [Phage 67_12]
MADLSDVTAALVTLVAGVVYPSGIGQPSVAATDTVIYEGWPNPQQLDADIGVGKCHVSIYPRPDERNTTRYSPTWQQASINTATLTLTVNGQTITLAGTIPLASNPTNLSVFANNLPFVYAVLPGDTLATAATALAALIAVSIPGTVAAGAVITLPSSGLVEWVRVGVTGTSVRTVRSQERVIQIAIWADTPAHRNALAKAIDAALAVTTFLALPDGTGGRLTYKSTLPSDALQKTRLYRRDLLYTVDYATTQTETETQITQGQINESAAVSGVLPFVPTTTSYF